MTRWAKRPCQHFLLLTSETANSKCFIDNHKKSDEILYVAPDAILRTLVTSLYSGKNVSHVRADAQPIFSLLQLFNYCLKLLTDSKVYGFGRTSS